MQAKVKSNSVVTTVMYDSNDGVTDKPEHAFALVFKVAGAGECKLVLENIARVNRDRAEVYGLNVRCTRAAALPCGADGKSASPADKLAAIEELVTHLASGSEDWSPKRVSAGRAGPRFDPILIAAVAEVTGKATDVVILMIENNAKAAGVEPKAYLAKLGTGTKVAPVVERMKAEQAKAVEIDADEALDGMME